MLIVVVLGVSCWVCVCGWGCCEVWCTGLGVPVVLLCLWWLDLCDLGVYWFGGGPQDSCLLGVSFLAGFPGGVL